MGFAIGMPGKVLYVLWIARLLVLPLQWSLWHDMHSSPYYRVLWVVVVPKKIEAKIVTKSIQGFVKVFELV